MNHLEDVLDKMELTEKGYKSNALSKREIQFNKGVSQLRYNVEHPD